MLHHRTAATARTPHAQLLRASSAHTGRTRAFGLRFAVIARGALGALHERRVCACGCTGAWKRHLAYLELLRLRGQTWTPDGRAV
jgi:hypothetical protein